MVENLGRTTTVITTNRTIIKPNKKPGYAKAEEILPFRESSFSNKVETLANHVIGEYTTVLSLSEDELPTDESELYYNKTDMIKSQSALKIFI